MLLQFSVENFRSIRHRSEITFVATSLKDQRDTLIPSDHAKYGVLPVLALYGANASGKSNLLLAFRFMRSAVLSSFVRGEPGSGTPYEPFCLDDECNGEPSTFILDFVLSDVRYQFGFSLTAVRIVEEWLYAFPKKQKQILYSRDAREEDEEFYFSRSFEGSNKQIQSITRENSLFISAATKSGHPLLTAISSYFRRNISVRLTSSFERDSELAKEFSRDHTLLAESIRYLSLADTGIHDVQLHKTAVSEEHKSELDELYKVIAKMSGSSQISPPKEHTSIRFGHTGSDGKLRYLDFADESLGTRYLFSLLPAMIVALRHGHVLILDEITTSLHTLLSRRLVSIFQDRDTNPKGAQLVFSTHDTNLLSPGFLRRDEIWFTEKTEAGETTVFPLTDIKTKNTDNIERGYVQGRFGAVPFLRSGRRYRADVEEEG